MLARQQPFQVLGARELRQGVVEPALRKAEHAARVVEHDLAPQVAGCPQRLCGAIEMAVAVVELSQPSKRHSCHRQCAGRHRLARPAVLLGDRDRPLAQLESKPQRLPP